MSGNEIAVTTPLELPDRDGRVDFSTEVVLVGGMGYLGTRFSTDLLLQQGKAATSVDLNIYDPKTPGHSVESFDPRSFEDRTVIWLASFHRERPGEENNPAVVDAYQELLVTQPLRAASYAKRFIYVSSMRSFEGGLYGTMKRKAEHALLPFKNAASVRFGTVWGGLSRQLPNRTRTAINHALLHQSFEGDTWRAHHTYISQASDILIRMADMKLLGGSVVNTCFPEKLSARELRELLKGSHRDERLQALFSKEMDFLNERNARETILAQAQDLKVESRLRSHYNLPS